MSSAFNIANEVPSAKEYCALRGAAGLSDHDEATAVVALQKSLHAVTIRDSGRLIAMGRVVGDGLHVQVVDIAVEPDFQGRGLSRLVMEDIMTFIATLPESTIVNLFADIDWLYQKFGFVVSDHTVGMIFRR